MIPTAGLQVCRLCRTPGDLQDSHIVPEFLHRPTYDERHGAIYFDSERMRQGTRRRGFWEELLCRGCEERIGQLESYFADLWFQRGARPELVLRGNRPLRASGLDYHRFKLFHLSILWRASIASLAPFQGIRLGTHEERLRTMLLTGDAGPADRYPLCGVAVRDDDGTYKDDMLQLPRPGRYAGHHFYSAMFGGVFWLYRVSGHTAGWTIPTTLTEDGVLLLAMQPWTEHPSIREAARLIQQLPASAPRGPTHR
jgi:hypothetical protein